MSARRQDRGQATLEAALGVIVLASCLIYAIHFGEVGFLTLKVAESSAAGLWEATGNGYIPANGYRHHWPKNDPQPFDQTPALVAQTTANVQARYSDLDGRTSTPGGTTITSLYTKIGSASVNCQMNAAPPAGPGIAFGGWGGSMMSDVYDDNGGLSCWSQAVASTTPFMPTALMDGTLFGTALDAGAITSINVCGFGRAWGGSCQSRYMMMLDDWAGEADQESGMCLMIPNPVIDVGCNWPTANPNNRFHDAGKAMFNEASATVGAFVPLGTTLAIGVVGGSPISASASFLTNQNEGVFFMSNGGDEEPLPFLQPTIPFYYPGSPSFDHDRLPGYGTSPGIIPPISYSVNYYTSWLYRQAHCFLGRPC